MFVNKRGIAEVIARAFLNLVMLGLFGVAVYMMVSLSGKSSASVLSAAAAVVPRVLFAVTLAIFAGMIFAYLYAGKFAGCFIDELLFPKRYLKNAPVILSKVQGAIAGGKLREALEMLENLQSLHPASPEIAAMLMAVNDEHLHSPEGAMEVARKYFAASHGSAPENLEMLLRFSDLANLTGCRDEAAALLSAELNKNIYSGADRSALQSRLATYRN